MFILALSVKAVLASILGGALFIALLIFLCIWRSDWKKYHIKDAIVRRDWVRNVWFIVESKPNHPVRDFKEGMMTEARLCTNKEDIVGNLNIPKYKSQHFRIPISMSSKVAYFDNQREKYFLRDPDLDEIAAVADAKCLVLHKDGSLMLGF